jgi:alpha-tubulin suppressor-like RCC1 family protein
VWAWGDNSFGELGNGGDPAVLPVQVTGLADVVEIAASQFTAFALRRDGTAWAWGLNTFCEAGIVGTQTILTPEQITALPPGIVHLTASVAVTAGGDVHRWGGAPCSGPRLVGNLPGVASLSSKGFQYHTLALLADGAVWAWGANDDGQLGDGTMTYRAAPRRVTRIGPAVSAAAGFAHSVVVEADGRVSVFGGNARGELGLGTRTRNIWPVRIPGITDGLTAEAGGTGISRKTVLLRRDGTVWSWGESYAGQLGVGMNVPRPVPALAGVVSVAGGQASSSAVTDDGRAWTWGSTWTGAVRDPQPVAGVTDALVVETGNYHSVVATASGIAQAWGRNAAGQLGDGTVVDATSAVDVTGLANVVSTTGGEGSSGAVLSDGTLWTWGTNSDGELGIGSMTPSRVPVPVTSLANVAEVDVGESIASSTHAVARLADGTVWTWGRNGAGQLGDGSRTDRTSPVQVRSLGGAAVSIAAGSDHSAAALADGTVRCWGWNQRGEIGVGVVGSFFTQPRLVPGLDRVVAVAAGTGFTLALDADGSVWGWGANDWGQLADGTLQDRISPQRIPGLDGIVAIACGAVHGLAIRSDGTLWAWGGDNQWSTGVPEHDATVPRRIAGCTACVSWPAEVSPPGAAVPLTVRSSASGASHVIEFGAVPGATTYRVHRGTIGSWYDHAPESCDTAGATMLAVPWSGSSGEDVYWLASAVEGECEGTLGWASVRGVAGAERPRAAPGCP